MNRIGYDEFVAKIKNVRSFILVSHQSPDGDGIGSCLALGFALRSIGKEVTLYSKDEIPANLAFLPFSGDFVHEIPSDKTFDIAIMLDCAQRKRISEEFAKFTGAKEFACVDHHLLTTVEAEFLLIDDKAASTGEVILRLLKKAGLKVTKDIAQCIYTTLAVDTGFFKYSNTTQDALAVAAELVGEGASPWEVSKNIEESHPAERMKLLALSLASLEMGFNGKFASMDVTSNMLSKSGATIELSDEFASYPRAISGVEVSALFRDVEPNLVKVSLRSKDYVDVAKIAGKFGGGGHARAAGFRMRTSIDIAKQKLTEALKEYLS